MAVLIFRLRNVPDDEAEDVRNLLDKQAIDWYETSAGNWGIAMPGIWIVRDEQVTTARNLIERYQRERTLTQRQLHDEQQARGELITITRRIKDHPIRAVAILVFCLFILYVSINPFLQMIEFSKQ